MLALLMYAYATGQRSSRRIERLCADHVAYRVVCAQDAPDHTTIARFRAEHDAALVDVFAQVLRLCAQAGMVRVESVAIDGTKIAANASMSANRSQQWVRERARQIAEAAVGEAAAAADRQEKYLQRVEAGEVMTGPPPAGVDEVRLWRARLARQQQRLAPLIDVRGTPQAQQRGDIRKLIRKAQARLADAEQRQAAGLVDRRGSAARQRVYFQARRGPKGGPVVNLTDPQARLMVQGRGGGSVQGYNSQILCSDDHLIIGVHVSQDANDQHCWTPALAAATTQVNVLGKTIGLVLADNGYFTEANLTSAGPERLIAPGCGRDVQHDAEHRPTQGSPPPELPPADAMRHTLRNLIRYGDTNAVQRP